MALNRSGHAEVFLSWEGALQFLAASGVKHFLAADADQDGIVEMVFTTEAGNGVLKWSDQQLETPGKTTWGGRLSLVVLEDRAKPEWIVVTSRKMLYGWRWQDGNVVSTRLHVPELVSSTYIPGKGS